VQPNIIDMSLRYESTIGKQEGVHSCVGESNNICCILKLLFGVRNL
jgi:hypothetical protein